MNISNEQAIEVLNDIHLQCCDASSIFNTLDWEYRCKALDMAIEALSAQSEIIRCKDCKFYDGRPCGFVDWYNTTDDFCSRAERRTDE